MRRAGTTCPTECSRLRARCRHGTAATHVEVGAGAPWLVGLRTALWDGALASVRPGGVVAYVTCSPHTDETVAVVDAAAARADVEVLPVAPLFPEVPGLARGAHGQLWPHRHGTDAMFRALLRRTC